MPNKKNITDKLGYDYDLILENNILNIIHNDISIKANKNDVEIIKALIERTLYFPDNIREDENLSSGKILSVKSNGLPKIELIDDKNIITIHASSWQLLSIEFALILPRMNNE